MAYLIDKGSKRHHEQLQGAHTLLLNVEKRFNNSFTGPMTADIDDHNFALQAADVGPWTHHRQREHLQDFGDEFIPLLPLMEHRLRIRPDKEKIHFPIDLPRGGVEFWAHLIKSWIQNEGALPSWGDILKSRNNTNLT
jgi:hypothetical protein